MTPTLTTHRYGPDQPARLLALHGLTGHGRRWAPLFDEHLTDVSVLAPDLLGHGRSPATAPWSLEAHADAVAAVLDEAQTGPVVVVAHSFGGATALHLAARRPDLVKSLVLLDPAIGLDGDWMRQIADQMVAYPDYTDRAEAKSDKVAGAWSDVPDHVIETELDEHLIELPNGRWGWRMSLPAVVTAWSELARDIALPANIIRVTLLRATRTSPPYVIPELLDALRAALGDRFELVDIDCDHMVSQSRPAETAAAIRSHLE
ncbi:alpha/beta fold hydrolase [Mycobacteroides immunogenum]|uniref:Alpha/beta hydrolase n=1 Tax=Mycobacteroides immunogenum TaxID=83262 RepID=A0A7V8LLG4_9MYCO|nr:alpha/beta hydrolase [Mycobacteroides immunogenum]AMT73992.1 alpha/beta hydrolase [Mycobacteroides immunogenum]ANO05349.1 alpha/beta hydrolase [Mycobacteroides immunogenum]KIU40309.1 alpha/beta hydrolase [Mycobacteroides immunogenum]KPG05751.1 alpha/beta hydrolase [Mycobacteroides immunogenum]KPG12739.1 alpha/beta hydrolase [Mycobacteroides immunogenum]